MHYIPFVHFITVKSKSVTLLVTRWTAGVVGVSLFLSPSQNVVLETHIEA